MKKYVENKSRFDGSDEFFCQICSVHAQQMSAIIALSAEVCMFPHGTNGHEFR
jgi:hypothetical protein